MKKNVKTLAKEYYFSTKEQYFYYIEESYRNGQKKQAKELFNSMRKESQKEFLIDHLKEGWASTAEIRKMCITELCS